MARWDPWRHVRRLDHGVRLAGRRLRQAVETLLDVLDLVQLLATVLRVVTAPCRLLLRLLDVFS